MSFFGQDVAFELNERSDSKCFFCQHPGSRVSQEGDFDGNKYECPICGNYSISGSVLAGVRSKQSRVFYKKLASVAAALKLRGQDGYVVASFSAPTKKTFTFQNLLDMFPQNFMEQLDGTLWNIAQLAHFSPLESFNFPEEKKFCAYTDNFEDVIKLLNLLKERGDIYFVPARPKADTIPQVHLTLQGYEYVRKMQLGQGAGTRAFVAMWFPKDNSLQPFRDAVNDAITLAGYKCVIADEYEHNNFIMDTVLNLIDGSKFVIADFTCLPEKKGKSGKIENGVRGGVYFEAGYAMGKGKPVIMTCSDDVKSDSRRHFDIAQFKTTFWNAQSCSSKSKGSLVHSLYNRIIRTVGPGPIVVPSDIEAKYKDITSLVGGYFDYGD